MKKKVFELFYHHWSKTRPMGRSSMTCQSMHERNKNNLINFEFKKSQCKSSVLHYCPKIIKIWTLKLLIL